jgi:hypothetical protein
MRSRITFFEEADSSTAGGRARGAASFGGAAGMASLKGRDLRAVSCAGAPGGGAGGVIPVSKIRSEIKTTDRIAAAAIEERTHGREGSRRL